MGRDERYRGQVVTWIPTRGYGFIECHELRKDIFVHASGFKGSDLIVGKEVTFRVEEDTKSRARKDTCVDVEGEAVMDDGGSRRDDRRRDDRDDRRDDRDRDDRRRDDRDRDDRRRDDRDFRDERRRDDRDYRDDRRRDDRDYRDDRRRDDRDYDRRDRR